jgi:RNA polymerase sigma factor (sigma-70 family)
MSTMTMTTRTVTELVAAARAQDRDACDELVHRYQGLVWSAVRAFRMSEADRADAVQMTWLRLLENLDRVRDPDRLGGWLTTTAARECLRIIRRSSRDAADVEGMLDQRPDERFPVPEQQVVDNLMGRRLWEHVDQLPAAAQAMLRALIGPDQVPYAELARRTGMPIGSIGPTRGRYLQQLRRRLEAAGLGADVWR